MPAVVQSAWERIGLSLMLWRSLGLRLRIELAAAGYLGYGYNFGDPKFAYPFPGVGTGRVVTDGKPAVTNCSTMTATLLPQIYPSHKWEAQHYGDLQVFADRLPHRPAAPVEAAIEVGVAHAVDKFTPGVWFLVQGWHRFDPDHPDRGKKYAGHAFFVYAEPDWLTILEASPGGNGGPRWMRKTESQLRDYYGKGLHIAALEEG